MTPVTALGVTAAWGALVWVTQPIVPPDGRTYLIAASGAPVASPFRWRVWALLWSRWVRPDGDGVEMSSATDRTSMWIQRVAVLATALLLAELGGLVAALLWLGLPVARVQVGWRWTADAVGQALAVACMVAPWWAQVLLGLAAGVTSERAPVLAAAYSWSPWPLVGLAVPAAAALVTRSGDATDGSERSIVTRPLASAREYGRAAGAMAYLAPWGAVLAAVAWLDARAWAVTAVAYGQCLVAVDRARLYQWAAPVWILALAPVLGAWVWWPAVVAVHWSSPWRLATEPCERRAMG